MLEPGIAKRVRDIMRTIELTQTALSQCSAESRDLADTVESERLRAVGEVLIFALQQLDELIHEFEEN